MPTPNIKEELTEAFEQAFPITMNNTHVWAAKWMAERCALLVEANGLHADGIRQLAKELNASK